MVSFTVDYYYLIIYEHRLLTIITLEYSIQPFGASLAG